MNRLFFLIVLAFSCHTPISNDAEDGQAKEGERFEAELAQKDKELALKERELELLKEQMEKDKEIPLSELYETVKSSVFTIYTANELGIAQGTAFTISSDGLALSNYHVFDKASEAIAINEDDQKFMITEIVDYNPALDYVLFRLGSTEQMPHVTIASERAKVGDECFTVGNPKGLSQTLSDGIVSSYRQDYELLQISSEITHGSSGGPLFNNRGEVIGITTGGLGEANLNFAVNITRVPWEQATAERVWQTGSVSVSNSQDLIRDYYSALLSKNWSNLHDMYAPKLKRYFGKFNIDRDEAVESAERYYKKFGVKRAKIDVRWDSFKETKTSHGVKAEYVVDYNIDRGDRTKPSSFVLEMVVEFTKDGKVCSIYENILSKE